jgi:hypothetical protein
MNKSTTKTFIEKAKNIHGNKYDYSKIEYVNSKTKVIITCPLHGDFKQEPRHHINGSSCLKCGRITTETSRKLTTNTFINNAKNIHGNKYDYSKSEYVNNKTKVIITCPLHGDFKQRPDTHFNGGGCKKCSSEKNGWNHHLWEQQALISNKFESFKLYVIKCFNDDEHFYKIGKTFNKIETRFNSDLKLPYNWEVINIIEDTAENISNLEIDLKRKFKNNSYIPKKEFGGMYECYSDIDLTFSN